MHAQLTAATGAGMLIALVTADLIRPPKAAADPVTENNMATGTVDRRTCSREGMQALDKAGWTDGYSR